MSLTVVKGFDSLPSLGVVEDDETVVKDENAIYRFFDLSTITSYSWDFDPADNLDTGNAFSSLSAGSNDSFSIEFFSNKKSSTDAVIFDAFGPRVDSIMDFSAESNSIKIYNTTGAVKYGPYPNNPYSIHLESAFDFIAADSSADSLSLFSPFTIEFWYNKYNSGPKDTIFSFTDPIGLNVLTLDEDGIIVNGLRHTATNAYTQNTWQHGALTYDGFNYELWKDGDSVALTRPISGIGSTLYEHDSGFMTIFTMDRNRSSSWSVRTTMSLTDKTLFYMGSGANRVEVKTINSGANLKLSAGNANGPSLTVPSPSDGEVHTISWDVQVDPGRVRLWIDSDYQGSNSIATSLPASQWAIVDITTRDSIDFTTSTTMIDSSTHSRTDGAEKFPSQTVFGHPAFSHNGDGSYNYRTYYPMVMKVRDKYYGASSASDTYHSGTAANSRADQYYGVKGRYTLSTNRMAIEIGWEQPSDIDHLWHHMTRTNVWTIGNINDWWWRHGLSRNTSGSSYVTIDNVSINRDGENVYYFEIDREKDGDGGNENIIPVNRAYLTMIETSKVGVEPYMFQEIEQASYDTYPWVFSYSLEDKGYGRGYISGDGIRTSPKNGYLPYAQTNTYGTKTTYNDYEHFIGGFDIVGRYNKSDTAYIISEPDNRIYYFENSRYLGYKDFPTNDAPYTLVIHKGHSTIFGYGLQHETNYSPEPVRRHMLLPNYYSYWIWRYINYYANRSYYRDKAEIGRRNNRFKTVRVNPNSWIYDPTTQLGLVPNTDRSAVATTGDGGFGLDSLGDSWEGSLKSNLLYNDKLYRDYKDCTVTVGESVVNNKGTQTGAEYAAAYVAKTGGTITTYSGGSGTNITSTVAALNEGDALVIPSGHYEISGYVGQNDENYLSGIWPIGVGFLICGETNNPNDVEIIGRGIHRLFNGNTTVNSALAFLHFIETGSTWYYYGDVVNGDAQGNAFKCIFNFNNGRQSWRLEGDNGQLKVKFDQCIFWNYYDWGRPNRRSGGIKSGRVDAIEVKNCLFQKSFGPAFNASLPTESPSFKGINLQNQRTVGKNLTRANNMSEWIISDYTPGIRRRYISDFMIHDSNKYNLQFTIDSSPTENDSNTNFILNGRVKDTVLSYSTEGIIKTSLTSDSIHSFSQNGGAWHHTSLNYNGDSSVLRTYIDGEKVDSSTININIDELKTSTIRFNLGDSFNPSTAVYDKSSGSFYLKEFRVDIGQKRNDSFQADITAQVAAAQDAPRLGDYIFMTLHDGTHPLDEIVSPYTADVKSWRKVSIYPNGYDSAYIHDIDGELMLELQEADGYRPTKQIGPKFESDGSGGVTAIQESDGSYSGTVTGYAHTQFDHPDSSLAFSRPSFVITLKDSDENGDSINWSYTIENFKNNILQIGHDSHNKTFYLKAYDITESNMHSSSSLRFCGKSTDSINNRPLVGSLDRPTDSSGTDVYVNFNYDGNYGLDISYVGDKQFMRLLGIDSISPTFDSTGFIFDEFPSVNGGII